MAGAGLALFNIIDPSLLKNMVGRFGIFTTGSRGMTILEAKDAATARKLLKSNNIDLLFTDIVMPGDINGHELADWASREYPDLKILLTTAMIESSIKQEVKSHSFQLLAKPYSKNELTETVSRLL